MRVIIVFVINKLETLAKSPPIPIIFLFKNSEIINKIIAMLKN